MKKVFGFLTIILIFSTNITVAQTTTSSHNLKKEVLELVTLLKKNVQPTKQVATRELLFYPELQKEVRKGQPVLQYTKKIGTQNHWARLTLVSYKDGYELLVIETEGIGGFGEIWIKDEGANGLSDQENDGTFSYNSNHDSYPFHKYGYGNINSTAEKAQTSTIYLKAIEYFKTNIDKKKDS